LSKDEAEREFRNHLGAERVKNETANHINIRVGKHTRTWVKNCIAIGLSAGFIEPLESTGIQIVHSAVHLLTTILKGKNDYNCADVAVYNKSMTSLLELIRDFLVCHYALTGREDTPYWKDVKYNTQIPESLVDKLILARMGTPSRGQEHMFDTGGPLAGFGFNEGWYYILTGMNYLPYDFQKHRAGMTGAFDKHIQDNLAEADNIVTQLGKQRQSIANMPSHYQYCRDNIYSGRE
jgi:tryptophan halogenase